MNKNFLYVIFLTLLTLTSSCQKKPMKKPSSEQTLRINFYSSPTTFHPLFTKDVLEVTICNAIFEGLTRINPQGIVELAIAEKIEVSPDKKKYTITLRPAKWSNGEKITSHNFIKSWEKALSPKCFHAKQFFLIKNAKKFYEQKILFDQVGIQTPSDTKIIIELEYPAPYFLQILASPLYFPVYEPNSEDEQIVFNGPFIIENYEFNKKLNLVANSRYWDAKTVRLKKIEISFIKDTQTAFSLYEEGYLDWIGGPFSSIPNEAIKNLSNIKFKKTSSPFWIFCNIKNVKLKSAKIRKILASTIDKETITKNILKYQNVAHTILPNEISLLDSDRFDKGDAKKAQELFEEGLKELNINKKDFQLTLSYSNTPDYERLASYLKHQWESILGIKVILKKTEWSTFYSEIKSGNYEIGGFYVINIFDDPYYFMELFENPSNHYTKWENTRYQKYFSLAKSCKDEQERKNYLEKAEEILMNEMPVIPVCNRVYLYACKETLKNFSPPRFVSSDFKWVYFQNP